MNVPHERYLSEAEKKTIAKSLRYMAGVEYNPVDWAELVELFEQNATVTIKLVKPVVTPTVT